MNKIKIQCPAKINLDLRVSKKDEKTGFHNIKSIMQAISIYDYLTINLIPENKIILSGTSNEIPYNEQNICYRAARLFLDRNSLKTGCEIYIEKNIPVCAGLAGGSGNGAGVVYGLNKLYGDILDYNELHKLVACLGSDLNFCLDGGTKLCYGRGEKIVMMPFYDFKLSIIKPKNLKISSKEAYDAFDALDCESDMRNDLEFALLKTNKYPELNYLHSLGLQMSGSGPVYFLRDKNIDFDVDLNKYLVINDLNSVKHGVREIEL